MTRSEKLNPALEVLEFKLNKQLSSLVELMQDKIENDNKLTGLINYKSNYLSSSNKNSQTITSIQIYHKLMTKLQLAIDAQQEVVLNLDKRVDQKIQSLQKDRAQTKALGILISRYRQQEIKARDRDEQKELDSQILAMLQTD